MKLDSEFIRLPLTFDAERLATEVLQFHERDWYPHPQGHRGNSALPLVAVEGDPSNDGTKGPMRPTPALGRCPYLQQVLASFGAPIGRTRLMRIDGNAEATPHIDTNYYWLQRVRIHVPIITDPAVSFLCGERSLHMAAAESWIFDTWRKHNVINPNATRRIHLVADTKTLPVRLLSMPERRVPYDPAVHPTIDFESRNFPVVMSPAEQSSLASLFDSLPSRELAAEMERFFDEWRDLWHRHGEERSGWPRFSSLLDRFEARVACFEGKVRLDNGCDAAEIVRQALIRPALNPDLAPREPLPRRASRFDRPIFIVSPPRSGSTLLFETLAKSPSVFNPGGESHGIIEGLAQLHPSARGWESNRLTADDAEPALEERFLAALRDRDGRTALPRVLRMLEKTPKNALRIPFLRATFPEALFIYLYRDPKATMSSMLDAWRSGGFVTYPDLPGWEGLPWSLVLSPGWRDVRGKSLAEIVAHQWRAVAGVLLDDLEALPPESWCVASYDQLVADPRQEIERLCEFVGIGWDRDLTAPLPFARHTLSPPDPNKWQRNSAELEAMMPLVAETAERARSLFARPPSTHVREHRPPATVREEAREAPLAFRSVHTTSFAEILREVGASILVSTYQSGRIVALRAPSAGPLDTHFVAFESPMGIAVGNRFLALGTASHVWDYRNQSALVEHLEPRGGHDACFLPRNIHYTGDIRVHEIAFDIDDVLWVVNTRFSALCTLDVDHSFVPLWRPSFISHLAPEDRCHLNGLAMVDGRPRFVTALGASNEPNGWREKKATAGVLIDVQTGEIVLHGLSMPHSPRWYAGRLWILESGKGTLATADLATGKLTTVAELPGFTRGLAFAGPYAFIGLSQVRESNVFGGIPLLERVAERSCGVWVIDLRSGSVVAFLQFEDAVQEIFDVQVLHGLRYPELLQHDSPLIQNAYTLPDAAMAEIAKRS